MRDELRIELEGISGPHLDATTNFNTQVARIEAAIADQNVEPEFPDCRTLKASQIQKMRGERQQATLELLQQRVATADERAGILESFEGHFQKALDTAEAALEAATKKAAKQLCTAGLAPETSRVYHANPGAAEVQFGNQVRQSEFVRNARAALATAEDQSARFNSARLQSESLIHRANDALRAFVRELLK